jgi:hypothetical protein
MLFLWLLVILLILFIGPLAAVQYLKWVQADARLANWVFWPVMITGVVGVGILSAYTFGDFFPGLGCFISLAAPLGGIITMAFVRWWLRKQAVESPRIPRKLAAGLIPLMLFCIPIIAFSYSRGCDAVNRRRARPIIAALKGAPLQPDLVAKTSLDFLVPEYISEIPTPVCTAESADKYGYEAWSRYPCENGLLLMVPILGSDSVQTYNLDSGEWSVGSAFDGYCQ